MEAPILLQNNRDADWMGGKGLGGVVEVGHYSSLTEVFTLCSK
jgi:hypothetical protein